MRIYILVAVLCCLVGCTTSDRYVIRAEGRDTVTLGRERVAYVANLDELRRLTLRERLEYVGTTNNYHIVKWWVKIAPSPGAVGTFAVPAAQFRPLREFTFGGIRSYDYRQQYIFDRDGNWQTSRMH